MWVTLIYYVTILIVSFQEKAWRPQKPCFNAPDRRSKLTTALFLVAMCSEVIVSLVYWVMIYK